MIKRMLCILLAVSLGFGGIPITASAEETVIATPETLSAGENTTWTYDEETATLTVSGTGVVSLLDWEDESVIPNKSIIESVVLEDGITKIGDSAFTYMPKLKSIHIPDTVTMIECYAFQNCTALESIVIPGSVTKIGSLYEGFVFMNCKSLKSVTLCDGTQSLGASNFLGCSSLEEIILPDSITEIYGGQFSRCNSLKSVTLPANLKKISDGFFDECYSLMEVKNAQNVEQIEGRAFYKCEKLEKIELSDALTWMGEEVFYDCKSLKEVYWPSLLTEVTENSFYNCQALETIKNIDHVTSIGNYAFYNCKSLQWANLPANLTTIGRHAFEKCSLLAINSFPESLTSIGENAFEECTSIETVEITPQLVSIGASAFSGCTGVKKIVYNGVLENTGDAYDGAFSNLGAENVSGIIGDEVTIIPEGLFMEVNNLTEVKFGSNVEIIGQSAFGNCTNLKSIEIPEGVTAIRYGAFAGCSSLKEVTLPESLVELGEGAFSGCEGLETVTLPANINELPRSCFTFCTSLKNVNGMDNIECINEYAFWYCYGLENIMLPEGLKTIKNKAFSECTSLETVTLPSSLEYLEYYAFSNCTSLKEINIPESLTYLGSNIVDGCSSLELVHYNAEFPESAVKVFINSGSENGLKAVIGDNVKTISDNLFYGCNNLKEVTGCTNVTRIGKNAFYECEALESIALSDKIEEIDEYAFYRCMKLNLSELPVNLKHLGKYAFYYCFAITVDTLPDNLTSIEEYTFAECKGIPEFKMSDDVTRIEDWAFRGCLNMKKIQLSENLESIGDSAFGCCETLSEVRIPESVRNIGNHCFQMCIPENQIITEEEFVLLDKWVIDYTGNATEISIPEGIVGICKNLVTRGDDTKQVHLPDSLKYISAEAFEGSYVEKITGGNYVEYIGEKAFSDTDWTYEATEPIIMGTFLIKYAGTDTEYRVPDFITTIMDQAFYRNETVKKVILPKSVQNIAESAFAASAIESIIYEDGREVTFLDFIGENGGNALKGTTLLQNIMDSWYVPGNMSLSTDGRALSSLVGRALARKMIESGEIESMKDAYDWVCRNVKYSGNNGAHANYAEGGFFYGYALCQGSALTMKCFLDELGYPNFILEGYVHGIYGRRAHAWNQVYIGGGWRHVDATDTKPGDYSTFMRFDDELSSYTWTKSYQWALQDETLENYQSGMKTEQPLTFTLQEDGTYWVTDCEIGAREVTIPPVYMGSSVTGIGEHAFADCIRLESIVIPEGIISIGSGAFNYCMALKEVKLPSTLKTLGAGAFMSCVYLKTVDLSETKVKSIESLTFGGCLNLMNIKFPYTIRNLDSSCISSTIINSISGKLVLNIYGYSDGVVELFASDGGYNFISLGVTPHLHGMTKVSAQDATCIKEGNVLYYKCEGCEKLYLDEDGEQEVSLEQVMKPMIDHDVVVDEAVEATCTSAGKTEGSHCSMCGKVYVEQIDIPMLDHTWDEGLVLREATCTIAGEKQLTCQVCEKTTRQEIDKLPHTYSEEWFSDKDWHWHECDCGKSTDDEEHNFEWIVDKEATIFETGIQHRECTVCHYKRNEGTIIDVVEHICEIVKVDAIPGDCQNVGYKAHWKCEICDRVFITEDGALGVTKDYFSTGLGNHAYEWITDVEATDDKTGLKHEECKVCGDKRNENTEIPALRPAGILGDVNCDGTVDTSDAQAIFNHFMGIGTLVEGEELWAADVNEDGVIDTSDAQMAFNMFMGII